MFGLGTLCYLILTGEPPAPSRALMAQKMSAEHALVPSAVADSVSPSMDALVRGATQVQPADRTESIRQFLKQLDGIEDELTRLRGIGSRPRYELIRLSRDWRLRFNLTETGLPRADAQAPKKIFPNGPWCLPPVPRSPDRPKPSGTCLSTRSFAA